MIYYITLLAVFMVLGYAVILLVKKITDIRKQMDAQQYKEAAFLNKIIAEQRLKADRLSYPDDLVESPPSGDVVFKLEKSDPDLSRNELRTLIFELIDGMTKEEMQQLLKECKERNFSERRRHHRKDFFRIIDYSVGDRYYRNFIQDISENGVFIETFDTFSVGQTILMTFMAPNTERPFKIHGEVIHVQTDGIGVKFKIESQVQEGVLKSLVNRIKNN